MALCESVRQGVKASEYAIKTPAKVNLRLKVTGVRPDGYHELVSLMVPVDLFDFLDIRLNKTLKYTLDCTGYQVPADGTNLVLRAAESLEREAGLRTGGHIRLHKNIPVSAGLGGGSSDAAAVLLSMNSMLGSPLTAQGLHDLAARLGADVPFFLDRRPAIARGIGDVLEPLERWQQHWYVIVAPPLHVSTAWVYRNYRLNELTRDEYHYIKNQLGNESLAFAHILENDLETVTSANFPTIETLKRHLKEAGAGGVLMSGSGPSVFGVFDGEQSARTAGQQLALLNLGDVFVVTDSI
jgi:4-diphosphocytidyl-2-C-methyl-D-erythritol kinase